MTKAGQNRQGSALQRFRRDFARYDYYPSPAAHNAVQRMRQAYPGKSRRVILDSLIAAGIRAYLPVSGN